MGKNTNFFERILQISEYYGIKSVNSFAKDYLKYDSSEKINRLRKENTNPSYEIIRDISNKFDEINTEWLITGKGSMIKNNNKTQEPVNDYSTKSKREKDLEYTIEVQKELIETLKKRLEQYEEDAQGAEVADVG